MATKEINLVKSKNNETKVLYMTKENLCLVSLWTWMHNVAFAFIVYKPPHVESDSLPNVVHEANIC